MQRATPLVFPAFFIERHALLTFFTPYSGSFFGHTSKRKSSLWIYPASGTRTAHLTLEERQKVVHTSSQCGSLRNTGANHKDLHFLYALESSNIPPVLLSPAFSSSVLCPPFDGIFMSSPPSSQGNPSIPSGATPSPNLPCHVFTCEWRPGDHPPFIDPTILNVCPNLHAENPPRCVLSSTQRAVGGAGGIHRISEDFNRTSALFPSRSGRTAG